MRDSQSLFDQLLAFGSDRIATDDVHQLLGTAGDDRLLSLFDAVIARRRDEALLTLDTAMNEGVQVGAFSDQLLHYLRDLLIIAAGADAVTLESVSESQRESLSKQATAWGLRTITAALEILAATKSRMQRVNYDRALLELADHPPIAAGRPRQHRSDDRRSGKRAKRSGDAGSESWCWEWCWFAPSANRTPVERRCRCARRFTFGPISGRTCRHVGHRVSAGRRSAAA